MLCLSIPIDHRVRKLIYGNYDHENVGHSDHVQILRRFGKGIRVQYDDDEALHTLSPQFLDFCLELARPEEKGGVTVVLYHPDPSQTYEHGFTSEEARCETLAAVKDLITSSTLGAMDTDEVTILDSMPFMEDDFDEDEPLHTQSHEVLTKALVAKQPNVVISCFQSESNTGFLNLIRHGGVGKKKDEHRFMLPGTKLGFTKIGAFHPSFAVNYHPYESCFRRLLFLQFAKAFAIWQSRWREEPFMEELRQTSRNMVRRYTACNGDKDLLSDLKHERFREILSSLSSALADLQYFEVFADWSAADIIEALVEKKLTWLLCDCGLFIRECHRENFIDIRLLCGNFVSWIEGVIGDSAPDPGQKVGLVEHSILLGRKSVLRNFAARELQNLLFTWLRQLNLGFTVADQRTWYDSDLETIADAMLRFASSMESRFFRWSPDGSKTSSIASDFDQLTLQDIR